MEKLKGNGSVDDDCPQTGWGGEELGRYWGEKSDAYRGGEKKDDVAGASRVKGVAAKLELLWRQRAE